MAAFRKSKQFVDQINDEENLDVKLELNFLADLTDTEYKERMGLRASEQIDIDDLVSSDSEGGRLLKAS